MEEPNDRRPKLQLSWNDLTWTAMRSSGAGGQHVNKTNSAVQLRFSISASVSLTEMQKEKIKRKLAHRLVNEDEILVRSEEERDQIRNKENALKRLIHLLEVALTDPKPRKATKPTKSSKRKRVDEKKHRGGIKKMRSAKDFND